YSYQAVVSDPGLLDGLSWQLITAPDGMQVSAGGLVTWTPTIHNASYENPVTLQVHDGDDPAEQSWVIGVDFKPTAVLTAPTSAHVARDVLLDGSDSTDSDGDVVGWDFHCGVGDWTRALEEDAYVCSYDAPGIYEVSLRVLDDAGNWSAVVVGEIKVIEVTLAD